MISARVDVETGNSTDGATLQECGRVILKAWNKQGNLRIKETEESIRKETSVLMRKASQVLKEEIASRIPEEGVSHPQILLASN